MNWPAVLLSISVYPWFLIFTYGTNAAALDFASGLAAMPFVAILPAALGLLVNKNALAASPMVIKLVLLNAAQYLLYLAVAGFMGFMFGLSTVFWGWQLAFWSLGAYFAFKLFAPGLAIHLRVVELGLVLVIPAVFLMAYLGFSVSVILTVIAFWFLAFMLTLVVEGTEGSRGTVFRYDIAFIHALVPILAGVLLFFLAFSGEVHHLLLATRQGLYNLVIYIINLLSNLFLEPTEFEPYAHKIPEIKLPEASEAVGEPSFWILVPFFIIMAVLLIVALVELISFLRRRLTPNAVQPQRRYSLAKGLLQAWKWLFLLIGSFFKKGFALLLVIKAPARRLLLRISAVLNSWLPAKTPEQKIIRCYEGFLRWGKRIGCPKKPSETPLAYLARLKQSAKKQPFPNQEAAELTAILQEAVYSKRLANWEQGKQVENLLKKIRGFRKTESNPGV